jgi:hypothetical protein
MGGGVSLPERRKNGNRPPAQSGRPGGLAGDKRLFGSMACRIAAGVLGTKQEHVWMEHGSSDRGAGRLWEKPGTPLPQHSPCLG